MRKMIPVSCHREQEEKETEERKKRNRLEIVSGKGERN